MNYLTLKIFINDQVPLLQNHGCLQNHKLGDEQKQANRFLVGLENYILLYKNLLPSGFQKRGPQKLIKFVFFVFFFFCLSSFEFSFFFFEI